MSISGFAGAQTFDQKIEALRLIIEQDPDLEAAYKDPRFAEAITALSAIDILRIFEALGRPCGSLLHIHIYRLWLTASNGSPDSVAAIWFNLGTEYSAVGDTDNKLACFKNSIAIRPNFYRSSINLGLAYEAGNQQELAISTWREALQGDDARIELLNNLGRVHEDLKNFKEAKKYFGASLQINPDQRSVLHHLIGIRTKTCDWPTFGINITGVSFSAMMAATRALTLLAVSDDIGLQHQGNKSWIDEKMPCVPVPLSGKARSSAGKIRIGYLSSDFCMHPMAYLIAELIETHDRSKFEVFGYCSTKDDGSAVRGRLLQAFDICVGIRSLTDEEAAAKIRSDNIDVLIDLNGLTAGTRLQVLRSRPAPIQLSYLGYNGPMPLPELDYLIADRYVIPEEQAPQYSPQPLYMDRCFQVNDSRLPVEQSLTRLDAGLPQDAFVYCCFSNTYKITEDIFAAWMAILARTDGTVLWVYVDNADAKEAMRAMALRHDIDLGRLIFANRVEASVYRGRLALADLFLDTYPYNAGTTASDALRVGLPLITISGESFISRMAGSLMSAMGLQDGIVSCIDQYIELAVTLSHDRVAYAALRERVSPEAWRRTLGDTVGFCRELEAKLETIVQEIA